MASAISSAGSNKLEICSPRGGGVWNDMVKPGSQCEECLVERQLKVESKKRKEGGEEERKAISMIKYHGGSSDPTPIWALAL